MTISKKMILTIGATVAILATSSVMKVSGMNEIKVEFQSFLNKITASRVLVTEIAEDLNYISRCTRDIMLGNEYSKNISKIESRKSEIEDSFDRLYEITDDEGLKDLVKSSKDSTIVFIKSGYDKMVGLEGQKMTPNSLHKVYKEYKREASPLAKKSREYFSQIQDRITEAYDVRKEAVEREIEVLEYKMVAEAIFIFIFIQIVLLSIRKQVLGSIKKLRRAINDIVIERNASGAEVEVSDDEFGEIQTVLNDYVVKLEESNIENEKLIQDVKDVVSKVSKGDLVARVERDTHDNSLKDLKDSMNAMLGNLEGTIGKNVVFINEILSDYANSDYTREIENDNGDVVQGVKRVGRTITDMLLNNQRTSIELEDLAEQLKEKVASLTNSSNNQAANLEEVTASIEEIAGNLRNSSANAETLMENSNSMQKMALSGDENIGKMDELISQINEAQKEITNAITVIDQIAFQTNILSLNAAVEAATAGEHGKGFAVVATEVRNLAAKSAEAATEIKSLVDNGTSLIEESATLSRDVRESFQKLLESIKETNESATSITNDTRDQMTNMSQIANTMNVLDTATQNNAVLAQETNDLANNTESLASSIKDEICKNTFEGKVEVELKTEDRDGDE